MLKSSIVGMGLIIAASALALGCDDDKKKMDDDVKVDAPGVDVAVEHLGAAGGSATAESAEE